MKVKEHSSMQNPVVKSPGLSGLNISLRNVCLLGTICALTMGLISTPYLQSSFETVIDEGKSNQMIPNVEPSGSNLNALSISEEKSDSRPRGASNSDKVQESSDRVNSHESSLEGRDGGNSEYESPTIKIEGETFSDGSVIDNISSQTSDEESVTLSRENSIREMEVEEVGEDEGIKEEKRDTNDLHRNLDEDGTPRNVVKKGEGTKGAEDDILGDDGNLVEKKTMVEETERSTSTSETTVSETRQSPSAPKAPAGESTINERNKNSTDLIEDLQSESSSSNSSSDQTLQEGGSGEEGSKDSETVNVLREKTWDEAEIESLQSSPAAPSQTIANSSDLNSVVSNSTRKVSGHCDIFKGHWIPDPIGPLYAYNSCRVLSQPQNCQANGRPDKMYEFWRWQPQDCDIPRLDPLEFLKVMEGKTLAFIGDSVARNQFESLMCILFQVAEPKNKGNKSMQRWYYPSHRFTLIRIWSGWLVKQSKEPFPLAPEDSVKLTLDEIDDDFARYMPTFDVALISSGHWWMRKSAYIVGGELRGGYGWKVNVTSKKKRIEQGQAFGIAMKNVLKNIGEIPNYKGLTVLRTYSPDHYEGGKWDTGGSCTGKTEPVGIDKQPENVFNIMMRQNQMDALNSTMQKHLKNRSSLALLDVFEAFNLRADGHPGPYRSPDPNKKTQRDEKGRPPPQDCLHWCMPGPVDTMNQMLLEVLKREFQKD